MNFLSIISIRNNGNEQELGSISLTSLSFIVIVSNKHYLSINALIRAEKGGLIWEECILSHLHM